MDNNSIWKGKEEFNSIIKFFDPEIFCLKEKKTNFETHLHIYKYIRRINLGLVDDPNFQCYICIDEKPLFIIRTTKKKCEVYLTTKYLPESCSFQFTEVEKSSGYGIKKWIWNGRSPTTNNYEKNDFHNLKEIIDSFTKEDVLQ